MAKDYEILNELISNTQELHRAIFDKGYEQGVNDGSADLSAFIDAAYEKGLNDAWKCAKEIACEDGLELDELSKIFNGKYLTGKILRNYSPSEAIERIKEYKKKQADAAIKQEQRTGYWIRKVFDTENDNIRIFYECSECNTAQPFKENYCPNCGAKMLEVREEE